MDYAGIRQRQMSQTILKRMGQLLKGLLVARVTEYCGSEELISSRHAVRDVCPLAGRFVAAFPSLQMRAVQPFRVGDPLAQQYFLDPARPFPLFRWLPNVLPLLFSPEL